MKTDLYTKFLLTAIAGLLAVVALQTAIQPRVASAATGDYGYLYVEPGTSMLRNPGGAPQVQGKVMIDMRNGDVWGFPTLSASPYPINTKTTVPPVSSPMYLGKFDFSQVLPH